MRAPTNSILISILTWIFIFNNLFHRIRNSQSDENHFVAVFFFFFFFIRQKVSLFFKKFVDSYYKCFTGGGPQGEYCKIAEKQCG